MYEKVSQQLQVCYLGFLVAVRHWLEILINGFLKKKVLGVGGYILAGGGRQWVVVDIFWLVVGGGGFILTGGGWWWMVMGGGGWWHSLV